MIAAVATAVLCAPAFAQDDALPLPGHAEILWDSYGIPHIFAGDDASLMRAFGWAQARNHGDLLLRLLGKARARGAEYWGEDELDDDRWYATMRVPERSTAAYAALPADRRALIDAFVGGINAFASAHPDSIADEMEPVLPVTGTDIVANSIGISLLFSGARNQAARYVERPGSNAWAIAPVKSASGHALLLANPHLPWGGGFTWIEAQLTAPGVNAYGGALVGMPVLAIAFNDDLGWTHTVNTQDMEDTYELVLAEGGYRFDGTVRAFALDTARLRVRLPDGSMREDTLIRRSSVHGPVLAERDGKALALRQVTGGLPGTLQHWDMMRARDLAEFERALAKHEAAGFNIVYADRHGDILYSYGPATPKRPVGDYGMWARTLRGDTSAFLWQDEHGYDDMPRVVNPPSGWVQNANDGPWYSTYPPVLQPDSFPQYFAPGGLPLRPQQSIQLLMANGRISLDDMIRLKHDTELELAQRLVPELIAAARAHGSADAQAAAGVLEAWDRTADADSRGGVLFQEWYRTAARASGGRVFAQPWSAGDPLATPDGLADPVAAAAALDETARALRARGSALDVAWGDVHRLLRDDVDLPANGASGALGAFRVTDYQRMRDGRMAAAFGDSYVAAIEFSSPVRARALVGYGNASQPGSPHRTDQLALYAARQLRAVWRTRAEINAHLRDRETF